MDKQLLEKIISDGSESKTLDFKQAQYSFSSGNKKTDQIKRAQFVKDIVSMYNTPRTETSYIVLGVKKNSDKSYELLGVEEHIDDAELQNKFSFFS